MKVVEAPGASVVAPNGPIVKSLVPLSRCLEHFGSYINCMNDDTKPGEIMKAAAELAKAVPIYPDAIQPFAKEIGTALGTIGEAVNLALEPISGLVWGYEKIKDFVQTRVAEKLKSTPAKDIQPPPPNIAGPALEALRYVGHDVALSELFANLLASALDIKTAKTAHPSFVEFIKQISPDEARLLRLFAEQRPFALITVRANNVDPTLGGDNVLTHFSILGDDARCEHSELTPAYLDNLCRLGLINIPQFFTYIDETSYALLENHPRVRALVERINASDSKSASIERKAACVTELGKQFLSACVIGREHTHYTFSW